MAAEFVSIGAFSNIAEAQLIKNKLDLAGLDSVISDSGLAYVDPAMGSQTGPVFLLVYKADLPKIRQTLGEQAQAG